MVSHSTSRMNSERLVYSSYSTSSSVFLQKLLRDFDVQLDYFPVAVVTRVCVHASWYMSGTFQSLWETESQPS